MEALYRVIRPSVKLLYYNRNYIILLLYFHIKYISFNRKFLYDCIKMKPINFIGNAYSLFRAVGKLLVGRVKALEKENAALRTRNHALDAEISALKDALAEAVEKAVRDNITKLFNRHFMIPALEQAHSLVARQGEYAFLFLDIDNFKVLNDTHGHSAGDAALEFIADLMTTLGRKSDDIGRWGGEEFVILMHNYKLEDALILGERIRAEIEQKRFKFDNKEIPITVSIGITHYSHTRHQLDPKNYQDIIAEADKALYRAKGRDENNQVDLTDEDPKNRVCFMKDNIIKIMPRGVTEVDLAVPQLRHQPALTALNA